MPTRITTTVNHLPADFCNRDGATLAQRTERAATSALRRVGGEAVEWGRKSGAYLNTARIATAAMPDSRLFGRVERGSDKPLVGIVTLIDSSGSMDCGATISGLGGMSRRDAARSIAVGITAAASRCGIASLVGHHGDSGEIMLAAHRTTRAVLNGPRYGGNRDAWAVSEFVRLVEMPAAKTIFVLVCDGAPNGCPTEHRAVANAALVALTRRGAQFILAYIGADEEGLKRARSDWGAARVADCRRDMSALTATLIRAAAAARA